MSRPVSRQSRLETLVFPAKTGGFEAEMVGFELGARWFEARGLLEWGESAYQPIQKLTGPKLADTRVSIQNTRYQRKTRRLSSDWSDLFVQPVTSLEDREKPGNR